MKVTDEGLTYAVSASCLISRLWKEEEERFGERGWLGRVPALPQFLMAPVLLD